MPPHKVTQHKLTLTQHSWALKVDLSIARLEALFTGTVITVRSVSASGVSWARGCVFTLIHPWVAWKEEYG